MCEAISDINDPIRVAKNINSRAANRTTFENTEQVSEYCVTPEAIREAEKVISNDNAVPEFWRNKYERELTKNWDLFYKRNTTKFFKDRMWLQHEFTELTDCDDESSEINPVHDFNLSQALERRPLLVELGCGVGNALIPILYKNSHLDAIGIDCSRRAIDFLNSRWALINEKNPLDPRIRKTINSGVSAKTSNMTDSSHLIENSTLLVQEEEHISVINEAPIYTWPGGNLIKTAVWNMTSGSLPSNICSQESADFVLLLFVLSAIPPIYSSQIAQEAAKLLQPGGLILFRDYARYDMTQLRFAQSRRAQVRKNFYVRQDGTLAYYFTAEEVRDLFVTQCGLEEVENAYFLREFVNRKTGKKMKRIWLQSKFRRPN